MVSFVSGVRTSLTAVVSVHGLLVDVLGEWGSPPTASAVPSAEVPRTVFTAGLFDDTNGDISLSSEHCGSVVLSEVVEIATASGSNGNTPALRNPAITLMGVTAPYHAWENRELKLNLLMIF